MIRPLRELLWRLALRTGATRRKVSDTLHRKEALYRNTRNNDG